VPGAQVTPSEHRLRIDRFLKRRLSEVGRGRILEWVRAGSVSVNGRPVSAAEYFVKQGDRVEWPAEPILRPGAGARRGAQASRAEEAFARPELALLPGGSAWESEWPPAVLHEDKDLLVINKPAGLPTNPSPAAGSQNVLSLLERGAGRLHLVHRLDRDTSGALVLARNARGRDRLLLAFRARRVDKLYDAVVAGSLRAASGSLRMRLLPHPLRSTRRVETVRRGGVAARTDYRVLERFRGCTRLEVSALSGRMHQVRAHLAAAGHPILGDVVYGRPHPARPLRLCLHARRLSFPHPRSGERLTIEAPLPADLAAFLEGLRHGPPAERQ
jgi:RluA family pseudouridine synthase